jgi:hypothetical protein
MKRLLTKSKSVISENRIMSLLAVNLVLYTLLFFGLAFKHPSYRDVYVGLATSMLTIGITVYFVDVIIKANEKAQWEGAENVARDEVATLSVKLVSSVVVPLSFPFMKEWLEKVDEYVKRDSYLRDITDWDMQKVEELGVDKLLEQLSADGWRGLYKGIQKLEAELRDCIMLYSKVIPPKTLGKLLQFNKDFKDDYSIFGNSLSVFVQQVNGAGLKKQTMEAYISHFTKDLEGYFEKIKAFRKHLDNSDWVPGHKPSK